MVKQGAGPLLTCPVALKQATAFIWEHLPESVFSNLKGQTSFFPFFTCFKEIWFHLDELNVNISVPVSCSSVDYSTIA